jgi:Putative beta-barrel porin 2
MLRNAGSDSNVFNDAEQPVSDSSAVIEPSIDTLLPLGRRVRVLGRGSLGLNYFQRESEERSTDLAGMLRTEIDVGPATLFGGVAGGRHKQRFSLEVDQRLDRTDQTLSAGLNLRLGRRLALGGAVNTSTFDYQGGVQVGGDLVDNSLDRDTRTYNGSLSYTLTSRTTLIFGADVVEDTFTDAPSNADTARSYRYTGGFSFAAGGLFTGEARAGWRHFPQTNAEVVPAFDGLALGVDLATHVGRLGALVLVASRDVNYAVQRVPTVSGLQRNSYVAERYGATLNTELPGSLLARGSILFDRAQYLLPYLESGQLLDRADRLRTVGAGLFRAFGSTFRVGGTIEWTTRESNARAFGYKRRVYGLSAEYTP